MKKISCTVAALSVALFLSVTAHTQENKKIPTTASLYGGDSLPLGQRLACRKDIQKLCTDYGAKGGDPANDSKALKCLYDNQDDLSEGCLKTLQDNNPDWSNPDSELNKPAYASPGEIKEPAPVMAPAPVANPANQ